ncbi:transcription factor EMB1444 [Aristolochia californica]|uniref:transcription factor EMB1444 n=1 Tax=Aristolochia californica TaxID=171875 RepID=UPI0035D94699
MGEDMTTYLQQTLRGLCYKTQWKYTIFWKLKYQDRLMLTWEDAYYDRSDSSDPSESMVGSMCPTMTIQNFNECQYKRDPLELALTKMSSLVYSLGEGVIGRVAFTGKHQWIFADKPEMKSLSSSELSDDLQSQFSAGIKTIAVVAVMPLGVVQLGSLSSMGEDLKLVTCIKDLFGLFCSSAFLPDLTKITNNITNLPGTMMKSPGLEASNDSSNSLGQAAHRKSTNIFPYAWSLLGKYNSSSQTALLLPSINQRKLFYVSDDHAGAENTEPGTRDNTSPLQSRPGNICLEFQKQVQLKQMSVEKIRTEAKWGRMCMGCSSSNDMVVQAAAVSTKSDRVDSQQTDGHGLCERIEMKIKPELEKQSDQNNSERNIGMENLLNFSAGCELQEALGPPFKKKQDFHVWEDGATQRETISHINDESLNSLFTPDDGSNHLLEAVVASACVNSGSISSESSLCKSTNISITDSMLQSPDKLFLLRPGSELIQRSSSLCSGLLEQQTEQTKLNRKKAKSGESGRPRPRDRQLIQDRIKELRQIVPNGSKCSIDALLEHTVKHMLFLQSVTRHAEKLKRYVESKLFDKGSYFLGNCNSERGASWVVEVGGQSKASPIIIENMDMNGQMLIEMLCEECNLFLEIAEVIRGMGLTILRGVIETRDGKTWACFVVEGQGKNQLQRMDIMWSLMRFFQPQP